MRRRLAAGSNLEKRLIASKRSADKLALIKEEARQHAINPLWPHPDGWALQTAKITSVSSPKIGMKVRVPNPVAVMDPGIKPDVTAPRAAAIPPAPSGLPVEKDPGLSIDPNPNFSPAPNAVKGPLMPKPAPPEIIRQAPPPPLTESPLNKAKASLDLKPGQEARVATAQQAVQKREQGLGAKIAIAAGVFGVAWWVFKKR